ncbi:MAG: hypothetical protein QE278_11050 [Limnobacter sp.]|nr:hypothetical protein [Limnobacter sp.]
MRAFHSSFLAKIGFVVTVALLMHFGLITNLYASSTSTNNTNWLIGSWIDTDADCKRPVYNFYKSKFINKTDVDGDPAVFTSGVLEYVQEPDSVLVRFEDPHTMRPWRDANQLVRFHQTGFGKAEIVHPRPGAPRLKISKCPIKTSRSKSKK